MALTHSQVKSLILSAGALAADIYGLTEEEAAENLATLDREFDEWVASVKTYAISECRDYDDVLLTLETGDRIKLIGTYWYSKQGDVVTVVSFDSDGDPEFTYVDEEGALRQSVAYGQGKSSYGWRLHSKRDEE